MVHPGGNPVGGNCGIEGLCGGLPAGGTANAVVGGLPCGTAAGGGGRGAIDCANAAAISASFTVPLVNSSTFTPRFKTSSLREDM